MSLYSTLLKQTWRLVKRNKYLWFFGIFATFAGGTLELELINYLFGSKNNLYASAWYQIANTGIFSNFFSKIGSALTNDPLGFANLLLTYLILAAVLLVIAWLSVVSQVAIIDNTVKIVVSAGKRVSNLKDKQQTIKGGIVDGAKHFWPVFGLDITAKLIMSLLFILVSASTILISWQNNFLADGLFVAVFFILVIFSIALAFIAKYIIAYIVVEGEKFWTAVASGWKLFWANWLISLEMAFVLFAVSFVGTLAILCALVILAIPLYVMIAGAMALAMFWLSGFLAIVGVAIGLLIIIVGGAILNAFQIAAWSGLFVRLLEGTAESKLIRLFASK